LILTSPLTGDIKSGIFKGNPLSLFMSDTPSNNHFFKYQEDEILALLKEYITGTYKSHYTSEESNVQVLDLIDSIGDSEAFCRSSAIKYLSRFGKKNGKSQLDLLKALHFTILLYHFSGLKTNDTQNNYETFN